MNLPESIKVTVHYSDQATVNAFATLGGHMFFYQGLIDALDSEDALTMVMAHEIAHIKYRHPIVATSRGLTMMALAASMTGASGSSAGELLIGQSINLGLLKFSRDQELESDADALNAVYRKYGHVAGAKSLFMTFAELSQGQEQIPNVLLSHPHSQDRLKVLEKVGEQRNWGFNGQLTPMPKLLNK